mgnify:CR=1 FL=1
MSKMVDLGLVFMPEIDSIGITVEDDMHNAVPWNAMDAWVEWLTAPNPPPFRASNGVHWVHLHIGDECTLAYALDSLTLRIVILTADWRYMVAAVTRTWHAMRDGVPAHVRAQGMTHGPHTTAAVAQGNVAGVMGSWATIWEAQHD